TPHLSDHYTPPHPPTHPLAPLPDVPVSVPDPAEPHAHDELAGRRIRHREGRRRPFLPRRRSVLDPGVRLGLAVWLRHRIQPAHDFLVSIEARDETVHVALAPRTQRHDPVGPRRTGRGAHP